MHISVIMPHFRQEAFLPMTLRAATTDQIRKPDLFILVDDGSGTDLSRQLLAPFIEEDQSRTIESEPNGDPEPVERVHGVFLPQNRGSAAAITAGMEKVRELRPEPDTTDCCTWISSDNVYYPEYLLALENIMRDPAVGAVYSGYNHAEVRPPGVPVGPIEYFYRRWEPDLLISGEGCFYGPSFLIRRVVWDEAGDHRGRISHDYDHWTRVEEACARRDLQILGLDAPLCLYGKHPQMATHRLADQYDAGTWRTVALRRRGLLQNVSQP